SLKNKKILLLTEEHTGNPYYWENVSSIQNMISSAGYEVELGIPKDFEGPITVKTINGTELRVHSIGKKDNQAITKNGIPELIISNNDFSDAYSTWGEGLESPVNPPSEFGWYRRKRHNFFSTYN